MKIIAFGAHPDDIEPQIGGTLAKFSHEGADVVIVIRIATRNRIAIPRVLVIRIMRTTTSGIFPLSLGRQAPAVGIEITNPC